MDGSSHVSAENSRAPSASGRQSPKFSEIPAAVPERPRIVPPELSAADAGGSRWQQSLARAIRTPEELLTRMNLLDHVMATGAMNGQQIAESGFRLLVPESYVDRMQPGDPRDPLLRQVLPIDAELRTVAGFVSDAVDDAAFRRSPGLLRKYAGRALLITTGSCAVHCRYCFRRHYPYSAEPRRPDDWEPALWELKGDDAVSEILLSGGDPLMLTDDRLASLIERLAGIPHLRRLRVHTRLPVVLPDRVTSRLLSILTDSRLKVVMVIHANHAAELVADCAAAVRRLREAIPILLNQAVLLRGVNDSVEALTGLSESLVDLGVVPYYLHQLDRVAGAAHFEVPVDDGLRLMEALRCQLPGYAVPRYVREIPGEPCKTVLA